MQVLFGFGKALLFFGVQAGVVVAVVQAVRWRAARKARGRAPRG